MTDDTSIDIRDVDTDYEQVVRGNAVFSDNPYSLHETVVEEDNFEADYDEREEYLEQPDADGFDDLDLRPIDDALDKAELDYDVGFSLPDFERDFTGELRNQPTYGAYAAETVAPFDLDVSVTSDDGMGEFVFELTGVKWVSLTALWSDWTFADVDSDPDTTDKIEDDGELHIEWDEEVTAELIVNIGIPDRYVGGDFLVTATAWNDEDDSLNRTAILTLD